MVKQELPQYSFDNLLASSDIHQQSGQGCEQSTENPPEVSPKSTLEEYPNHKDPTRGGVFPQYSDLNDLNNNNSANNTLFNIKDIEFTSKMFSGHDNFIMDAFQLPTHSNHVDKNGLSISSSVESDNSESVFSMQEQINSPDVDKHTIDSASKASSPSTTTNTRKASKNSCSNMSSSVKGKGGRTSHNMIEKKYRTNINSKILALRDAVPSLRVTASGGSEPVDLEGLTPATKLNKASVLTKAAEYIHHLEKKNKQLLQEVDDLKKLCNRLASNNSNNGNADTSNNCVNLMPNVIHMPHFGVSGSMNPIPMYAQPAAPTQSQQQFMFNNNNNNNNFMQQMMPQPPPTNIQQMAQPQQQQQQINGMSMPMKLAMGGMIGLMGSNLLAGGNPDNNDYKGLSALPFSGEFFKNLSSAANYNHTEFFIFFFKMLMLVYCFYIFFIYNAHSNLPFFNGKSNGFQYGSLFTKLLIQRIPLLRGHNASSQIDDKQQISNMIKSINDRFFNNNQLETDSNNVFKLWDLYNTLSKYKETPELSLYKSLLQKMMSQSSFIFKFLFKYIGSPIVNDDVDSIQRLLNVFYKVDINKSISSSAYDESYANIMNDAVINGNLLHLYRNFKANQIFRDSIQLYLSMINICNDHDDEIVSGDDEIDSFTQMNDNKLNKRLVKAEKLAVDDSILKLTIGLFSSLLYTKKLDQSTEIVKKAMEQVCKSNELNRTSLLSDYYGVLFNYNIDFKSPYDIEHPQYNNSDDHYYNDEDDEDDDSTYVGHDFNDDDEKFRSLKYLDDSMECSVINGELYITLICCLISKYLNEKNLKAAENSLMDFYEHRNKYLMQSGKQISLLSFVSIYKVLIDFEKQIEGNISEKEYSLIFESLVLCLRFWIGTSNNECTKNFDKINSKLKAEICDQLIIFGTRASGTEIVS